MSEYKLFKAGDSVRVAKELPNPYISIPLGKEGVVLPGRQSSGPYIDVQWLDGSIERGLYKSRFEITEPCPATDEELAQYAKKVRAEFCEAYTELIKRGYHCYIGGVKTVDFKTGGVTFRKTTEVIL